MGKSLMYRVWYHPQFQASTGVFRMYPLWIMEGLLYFKTSCCIQYICTIYICQLKKTLTLKGVVDYSYTVSDTVRILTKAVLAPEPVLLTICTVWHFSRLFW